MYAFRGNSYCYVPNEPCGVERWGVLLGDYPGVSVPNEPCGVESITIVMYSYYVRAMFLMNRVELKEVYVSTKRMVVPRS